MLKRVLLAVSIVLGVYAASYALPSTAQHEHDQPAQVAGMAAMMKMHQQMMAEMKAADARLDDLLRKMNAVTGEARVAAMADVVNELAGQQKAMHERMPKMHEQMMGGRGMATPKQ